MSVSEQSGELVIHTLREGELVDIGRSLKFKVGEQQELMKAWRVGVQSITANGDVLALIKSQFENVPTLSCPQATVKWRGQWAVFILDNIDLGGA